MEFVKYQHVERFGTSETEGIEDGTCYIFPKIDGTNSSLWLEENVIHAGSRNREISLEKDNGGFFAWVNESANLTKFKMFFERYPNLRLFGEFLIPHSLKTYLDTAWRNFYVFDVIDETGKYLHYEHYKKLLDEFEIEYIPCLCYIQNPRMETLIDFLDKNTYLIKDGQGFGEGIVIKNFYYSNKFGRVTWAKIVRSDFKVKNLKVFGSKEIKQTLLAEEQIIEKYVTTAMIDKVQANIVNEKGDWSSKYIMQLLNTVFYDLIKEETWNFVKEFKNPKIDFSLLHKLTIQKIKQVKNELF